MSIDAKATVLYGVCFKRGTPEFNRLDTMDWTPIEKIQEASAVRFALHGGEEPSAYVVGIPVVQGEVYSWQDPALLAAPDWGPIEGALVLTALLSVGFTEIPPETAFGWYLAVHVC